MQVTEPLSWPTRRGYQRTAHEDIQAGAYLLHVSWTTAGSPFGRATGGFHGLFYESTSQAGRIWSSVAGVVPAPCDPPALLRRHPAVLRSRYSRRSSVSNPPQGKEKATTGVKPAVAFRSGWADLNRRPLVPQTSTLNPCATARCASLSYPTRVVMSRKGLRRQQFPANDSSLIFADE